MTFLRSDGASPQASHVASLLRRTRGGHHVVQAYISVYAGTGRAILLGMNTIQHPVRGNDVELSSETSGTREVALVSGVGGCISFELYEVLGGTEHYEGRTNDGRYAREWLEAAE